MLRLGDHTFSSRLLIGSSLYPSPEVLCASVRASRAEIITVALRRQNPGSDEGRRFWDLIRHLGLRILPNTAGCRTADEAVTVARMARELFATDWIKLEVIGDDYTLQPDVIELVKAAETLAADGFEILPYTTEDLVVAQRLVEAGCRVLMPWAAPIGSGQGPLNPRALRALRERLPGVPLICDAGLGRPSHAAQVMEMGFDGILINSAVALADDPVKMARAFADAVAAGRLAYEAGPMSAREMAAPSTPVLGTPFWHQEETPS